MRMWLVDPKIMCRQHLLGEHLEMHMFLSSIKKKKKLDGFIKGNMLEPMSLYKRHEELKDEMVIRGYNHKSLMSEQDCDIIYKMPHYHQIRRINVDVSLKLLLDRCSKCRKKYEDKLRRG